MIFREQKYNTNGITYFFEYHPYHRGYNPKFDDISSKILDLKRGQEYAINFFYQYIEPFFNRNADISVVVVPSHDPEKILSGICLLAKKLAVGRTDATSCLLRYFKIDKFATGGIRNKQVHLDSIAVQHLHLIRNKYILLLDDVTTTHTSLLACKELLEYARPRFIKCVALSMTK